MSRFARFTVLALLAAAPAVARAGGAADTLAGGPPPVLPDTLAGAWEATGAAHEVVQIATRGNRIVSVHSPEWESIGFLDGSSYSGVVRKIDPDFHPVAGSEIGTLRFDLRPDGAIDAVLKFPSGAPRIARWTRLHLEGGGSTGAIAEAGGSIPEPDSAVVFDEPPVPRERRAPAYPEAARRRGIQGTVMLRALIGSDGRVKDVRVLRSIAGLDEAAIEAVRTWTFDAARAQGEPIAVWASLPVTFTLH